MMNKAITLDDHCTIASNAVRSAARGIGEGLRHCAGD
jgi:hypothetical protein